MSRRARQRAAADAHRWATRYRDLAARAYPPTGALRSAVAHQRLAAEFASKARGEN